MERRIIADTTAARTQAITVTVALALILLCSLVLPLLLAGNTMASTYNQYLIGPIVNATLIYSAARVKGMVPMALIVCAPSALALTTGLFFSLGTVYALYMIPAIWLGNIALVVIFRTLHAKRSVNYALTSVIAVALKAVLIFGVFSLLVSASAIPAGSQAAAAMTSMMGIVQVFTGMAGSVIAFGALRIARSGKKI